MQIGSRFCSIDPAHSAKFRHDGRDYHIFKRRLADGSRHLNWSVKFAVAGKTVFHSLGTPTKHLAIEAAKLKIAAAKAGRWDALRETRIRRDDRPPTIGEILACYQAEIQYRTKIGPATVKANANALRNFIRRATGATDPDAVTADRLDRDAMQAFRKAAGDGTTAASIATQARAVFSAAARLLYADRGLRLPAKLDGFLAAQKPQADADTEFRPLPPKTLAEIAAALPHAPAPIRLAVTLAIKCGLRAGEIVAARRSWIEEWPDGTRIAIVRRPDWSPKGREGRVPLSPETAALVAELAGPDHLIDAPHDTARRNAVERDTAHWLRQFIPDRLKPLHELRKHAGSVIATRDGLLAARDFLRHMSVTTTERHYASLLSPLKAIA